MSNPAVLISIRPIWCGKIFDGTKNLEFRKAVPKIELPFKCYVYCTAGKETLSGIIQDGDDVYGTIYHGEKIFIKFDPDCPIAFINKKQKVVGELLIDRIDEVTVRYDEGEEPVAYYGKDRFLELPKGYILSGGFTLGEYIKYKGKGKVYGWHIAEYRLFDKPMDVKDFSFYGLNDHLRYPPQSYCFVNELKEEA